MAELGRSVPWFQFLLFCLGFVVALSSQGYDEKGSPTPLSWGSLVHVGDHAGARSLSIVHNPKTGKEDALLQNGEVIVRSLDGGKSWQNECASGIGMTTAYKVGVGGPTHNFGDTHVYAGRKTPFKDFHGINPTNFSIDAEGNFSATIMHGTNISFTGLLRPMGCIQTHCCGCPFRLTSGNTVLLPNGSLLIIINVFLQPPKGLKGDGSSVVAYVSDDGGFSWNFRSYVALAEDYQWSGEGPNEATISMLADGKTLICVIRMDAGDGGKGGKPYHKTFSKDGGKTWTKLESMGKGVGTAKPHMVLMDAEKGPLVLAGGRPGNKVWVNHDGMGGSEWVEQDMETPSHCAHSSAYNGAVAISADTGIVAFQCGHTLYALPFTVNRLNNTNASNDAETDQIVV